MASIHVGAALAELIQLTFKYQIRVPPELSLMVKMLMTVESLVSQLDPELSLLEIAEPWGRRIMRKRYSPSRLKDEIFDLIREYAVVLQSAPHNITSLMEMIEQGEIKIKMEHTNIKELSTRADILSNRVSIAIVIASLIVGTSLAAERISVNMIGVSLVQGGFFLAVILGLYLIYSIIRGGRY
jgi:ubiquinone biosynthesis protein